MQTLSDFLSIWSPAINQQAKEIAAKIEAGADMSRYLLLEPRFRDAVDGLCREYSGSLSVAAQSLNSRELGYLFHLRVQAAEEFARFLDDCGLGANEMSQQDWIEFLAIDAWREFLVHKWRHDFSEFYRKRGPA